MRCFAFLLGLWGTSASAGDVVIKNCEIEDPDYGYARCDVTNGSDVAIAAVHFYIKVYTPGRAVPWFDSHEKNSGRPSKKPISGGVEPNETVSEIFGYGMLPDRAKRDEALSVEVVLKSAEDASGDFIEVE